MQIELKKIRKDAFDDLMKDVTDGFEKTGNISLQEEKLELSSENILVNGVKAVADYSLNEYLHIVNDDVPTYEKLAMIGMLLHKETKNINGNCIPENILYEKEFWAYLSFKAFTDVIKKLRLDDDDKITSDKIERFYFNAKSNSRSGLSRTGLLFIWTMIDSLESENDEKMSKVAFHFIDPVKAIYERDMSKNHAVLKAFVQAIINNNCDPRIKNNANRLRVPNNVSCMARINMLDAYDYDELVSVLTNKISEIIGL